MIHTEINDDGFRVTEIGAFRWRVNPDHVGKVIYAVKRRHLRESSVAMPQAARAATPSGPSLFHVSGIAGIAIAGRGK